MIRCPQCGAENPAGARFCNACGERLVVAAPAEEVRKTVTVVFCDVTGSTALGERLDPEALRRVMSRYFASMTEEIERHGGTVEKFIGDAVMAVFGIPTTHEDDALRAVRAAAGMQDALKLLNKELERDQGAALSCRIGVHTGEVVAGDASLRQAMVTGDAVNVAARLEQGARPGEILISDATLRLVRDAVVVEEVDPLEAKGKTEPVPANRLVGVNEGAAGVARRLDSPMIGRVRPLDQLMRAFDEIEADRVCHLFTVLGSAGVGKSRLIQEAIDRIGDRATVVRGRCISYGEGITYWPLVEIVRSALGPGGDEQPDLRSAITRVLLPDPAAEAIAARVAQLVGTTSDVSIPAEEIAWAIRRFFEVLAAERSLIVVVDDLHWAEPGLLDLLDHVADLSRDAAILLVCMARPELLDQRADWGGGKLHATTAALEPLSERESALLIENLLGPDALDTSSRARILSAAEGNPLFVEETIAMLVDEGSLRSEDGRWIAAEDLERVAVPPTIQALLDARLDRLGDADRATLGRASVIGQVFYVGAVAALSPQAERVGVIGRMQQLVRRDLIRPDRSDVVGEDAFRFRHGMIRDAAYAMLPKEVRADLHERLADWLEGLPGGVDIDEFVGYHLERAHALRLELGPPDARTTWLGERAASFLSVSATNATARADLRAAENLFGRAAALRGSDDIARAWDLIGLGWARLNLDRVGDAIEPFATARAIADRGTDERLGAHAALGEANAALFTAPEGAAEAITNLVDTVIPRLTAMDDSRGLAIALYSRGYVYWQLCQFEAARTDMHACIEHARRAGDRSIEHTATIMGAMAGVLGTATATQILAEADRVEQGAATFPTLVPIALAARAHAQGMLGRFDEARALLGRATEVQFELQGYVPSGFEEGLWRIEMWAGNLEAADRHGQANHAAMLKFGDVAHASTAAGERASTCYLLGRFDEARRLATECRDTGASDDVYNQHLWRSVEAAICAREGEVERADRLIAEAIDWAERSDDLLDRAMTFEFQADISARLGRRDAAAAALAEARSLSERKGATSIVDHLDRVATELDPA